LFREESYNILIGSGLYNTSGEGFINKINSENNFSIIKILNSNNTTNNTNNQMFKMNSNYINNTNDIIRRQKKYATTKTKSHTSI
jgi:hypothetical protein